ncbi:MAG: DUF1186 domain-containing protein [Desulfosalsimonadaceae bacterium]|nr:DUF1186 domain-containing protein [Desulfosalsimonadaceae bacterium]
MINNDNPIIGYSAFTLFGECYEYCENACYIADSPESLTKFLEDAGFKINNYRIDTIALNDISDDYGCSGGEFAMEPEALKRFEQISGVTYTVKSFDDFFDAGAPELFVVRVDNKIKKTADELSIPEILATFKTFGGIYKREHIDAAIMQKQEITPSLIEILENLLTVPDTYAENQKLYDHIYAVMLLGHFKEPKAHKVIIDLFSLPGDMPDQLFGDICTSNLPVILLNTCGGAVESIQSMILNREADDYCRVSACQAFAYAVVEGYVSREKAVAFFNTLFTGEEADEISDFWGLIAGYVCALYPEESMDVIKQAYEDDLIMPGMIPLSDFEHALKIGKDQCLEELRMDLERNRLDDIHAGMSWWSCFNEKSKTVASSGVMADALFPGYSERGTAKFKNDDKKGKKKKRKQTKASKKKNRR